MRSSRHVFVSTGEAHMRSALVILVLDANHVVKKVIIAFVDPFELPCSSVSLAVCLPLSSCGVHDRLSFRQPSLRGEVLFGNFAMEKITNVSIESFYSGEGTV